MRIDVYNDAGYNLGSVWKKAFLRKQWMNGFLTYTPTLNRIVVHYSEEGATVPCRDTSTTLEYMEELQKAYAKATVKPMIKKPRQMLERKKAQPTVSRAPKRKERQQEKEDEDPLEMLRRKAHSFVFDDEAFSKACICEEALSKLPYPVCFTEGVFLYESDGAIRTSPVMDDADEMLARRLMAFVNSSCSAIEEEGGAVTYHCDTLPPVEGVVKEGSVRKVGNETSGHGLNKHRHSPRVHSRRGHQRKQAYGPNRSLRKTIWIDDTIVNPAGNAYKVTDITRIHLVTIA